MDDDGTLDGEHELGNEFAKRAYLALAANLERCGRPLDAANVYETKLKMYDDARKLREKDKQVIVKRTDISVNLNDY